MMHAIPARRPGRRRPCSRGQAAVIFALCLSVLLAVSGLGIDAGTSYLLASRELRAAQAAALTGVTYMPNTLNAGDPPVNAALIEAAKNGFANGDTTGGRNVRVTVSAVVGQIDQLQVTVTDTDVTSFLRVLGFTTHDVTQSAKADFLVPLQLGQPGSAMGGDVTSIGNGSSYYFMRTEGWSSPRSEGDAFTPDPSPGTSYDSNPDDIHQISNARGTDTVDAATLPSRGGYNYLIYVPQNGSADVQVFNPMFAPDHGVASGLDYHEYDGSWPADSQTKTDFSAMEYSLYRVPSLFSHNTDVALSHTIVRPINAVNLDDGTNPTNYVYWDASGTSQTVKSYTPTMFHQWIDPVNYAPGDVRDQRLIISQAYIGGKPILTGGAAVGGTYYRLRVDDLAWNGASGAVSDTTSTAHKGYAVRVVNHGTSTACATCTMASLDDMCIFTPMVGGTFQLPLFSVPATYKGQTLAVYVFDPGDVSGGNAYMKIVMPAYTGHGSSQTASAVALDNIGSGINGPGPTSAITPQTPGQAYFQTANGGGVIFGGKWVRMEIAVPLDWNPLSVAQSYWQLEYDLAGGAVAGDTITVQVSLTGGTPVHLLP